MNAVVLARHGQALAGSSSPARTLTDIGRRQARAAAAWIAPIGIERVVATDTARARETAALMAPHSPAEPAPGLEGLRIGGDETPLHGVDALSGPFRDPRRKPPGGESLAELQERASGSLAELAAISPGPVLAVAHRFVCTVVVAAKLDVALDRAEPLLQDPGAVNVSSGGEGTALRAVNATPADPYRTGESGLVLPDSQTKIERRRYLLAAAGVVDPPAEEALRSAVADLDGRLKASVEILEPDQVAAACVEGAGLGASALSGIPAAPGSVAILDRAEGRWWVRCLGWTPQLPPTGL